LAISRSARQARSLAAWDPLLATLERMMPNRADAARTENAKVPARLVQADLLPVLIATTLVLTICYAVTGYLGNYQGGKLWVSASSVSVEESHANRLSRERRAFAIALSAYPSRDLGERESLFRLVNGEIKSFGDPLCRSTT
jgi:hypothetical protein